MTIKLYAPIPNAIAFDPAGVGPFVAKLNVFAALDPSPDYPAARVSLSSKAIGALSLTAEQAAQLEARLAEARRDVDAAEDAAPQLAFRYLVDDPQVPAAVYDLANGRCECCGEPIAQGAAALAYREPGPTGQRVALLHAERCPEPEMWVVEYAYSHLGDPLGMRQRSAAMAKEEAAVVASDIVNHPRGTRVRLVRVRSTCTAQVDCEVRGDHGCTYRKKPCGRAAVDGRCERHREVTGGR